MSSVADIQAHRLLVKYLLSPESLKSGVEIQVGKVCGMPGIFTPYRNVTLWMSIWWSTMLLLLGDHQRRPKRVLSQADSERSAPADVVLHRLPSIFKLEV